MRAILRRTDSMPPLGVLPTFPNTGLRGVVLVLLLVDVAGFCEDRGFDADRGSVVI